MPVDTAAGAMVTGAVTEVAAKNSMKKADFYWSVSSNLIPISREGFLLGVPTKTRRSH